MSGCALGSSPRSASVTVAGRVDELLELRVRHLVAVDPEAVDADDMGEALLGLMALGAHLERAAGDERHAGGLAFLGGEAGVRGAAPDLGLVAWRCSMPVAKAPIMTPASTVPNPSAPISQTARCHRR